MGKKYLLRHEGGQWSNPMALAQLVRETKDRAAKFGNPYEFRKRGDEWGVKLTLPKLISKIEWNVPRSKIGAVWGFRCNNTHIFQIRVVEIEPRIKDTEGVRGIDEIYTAVITRFPQAQNWGICNCRHIDGSENWSKHSWCEAWDIGGRTELLDEIYQFLKSHQQQLGIDLILYRVEDHYDHIHVQVGPNRSGQRPPCA